MAEITTNIYDEINDIRTKIADALTLAKSYGVSAAEIAISRQRGLSASIRNGEVETVEFNQDGALGISVYRGNQKGSASTADLSKDALERTVKAACDIARYTSSDECTGLAEAHLLELNPPDLDLYHPTEITPEIGIAIAQSAEAAAYDFSNLISNSDGASFGGHEGFRVYGNTHGQMVGYPSSRYSLSCGLLAQHDGDMQRSYEYTINRKKDLLDDPVKVGRAAAQSTIEKLNARKIDTTKAPVIFRADAASSLISHLVSAISGGSLYRKSTFLLDKLDCQVLSKAVNIIERPHILRALASSPFDSEGMKTVDRDIITDGVLNTYLLTSYAARKLGMQPTGHAGGIHNWCVQATMGNLADMAREMGRGMIVTDLMGQGVNVVNGDYSRGASGFWVENGEIQYPVNEVTIAGNLADIFMNIVGCGNDIDSRGNVHTGSILVDNIQIAGS